MKRQAYVQRAAAVAALLFLLAGSASAQDKWIAPDKALHLAVGVVVGGGATALAAQLGAPGDPRLYGAGLSCVAGAGKELYDLANRQYHTPSWRDFAVTCVGGLAATYTMGWMLSRQGPTTVVSWQRSF